MGKSKTSTGIKATNGRANPPKSKARINYAAGS